MEREHEGKKYSIIMGRPKGSDSMMEQAYRYPKDSWSVDQARSHCKSHDGSFEAASGGEEERALPPCPCHWLRVEVKGPVAFVDRENRVVRGMVLAQEGVFKDRRGEFDESGLREVVKLTNRGTRGLKSRLSHPTASDDGVGKFLGRARNARLDRVRLERDDKVIELAAARADLYLDPTASKTPHGDLADYVLSLAESDPQALSASLVLEPEEVHRIDKKGKPLLDGAGRELPPLWIPRRLHAVDVVDEGAATDGLLSPEEFAQALSVGLTPELERLLRFDNVARLGAQLLDGLFKGRDRSEVRARCLAWLDRYLDGRHEGSGAAPTPLLDARRLRLDRMALEVREAEA